MNKRDLRKSGRDGALVTGAMSVAVVAQQIVTDQFGVSIDWGPVNNGLMIVLPFVAPFAMRYFRGLLPDEEGVVQVEAETVAQAMVAQMDAEAE